MPTQQQMIQTAMSQARNGGDYRALFAGKTLAFKFSSVTGVCGDLQEQGEEVVKSTGGGSVPPITVTSSGGSVEAGVVDKIIEIANMIRNGIGTALSWLKEKFMALVNSFSKLKESLTEALSPLLSVIQMSLEWVIDLLFKVVPQAFVSFVTSLIAAIAPFVGQIKAAGEMLVSVGKAVKGYFENRQLLASAQLLDSSNRFTHQARAACERMMDKERNGQIADAALSTANCTVSIAGLFFTGNVASTVAGIATAVYKLCAMIGSVVKDCWYVYKGNAELEKIKTAGGKLNPMELFAACPLLGAYYIGSATQSSIIAYTGMGNSVGSAVSRIFRGGETTERWMVTYQEKAKALGPFRAKAQQFCLSSRLELGTSSVLGIVWDVKDTLKSGISDMISGGVGDVVTGHVGSKFGIVAE